MNMSNYGFAAKRSSIEPRDLNWQRQARRLSLIASVLQRLTDKLGRGANPSGHR